MAALTRISRQLWAIRILSLLVLLVCAPVEAAETPAQNSYPISLTRGSRLMISVRINGHPVEALLDSAAEATLVDREFATSLQLVGGSAATGHGSGESAFEATLIKGVRLQTLGLTLENQTVAVTDLTDVGKRLLGHRIDVILGREIFDAARLLIDIEGRQISVVQADHEPAGTKLKLVGEHGVETIPVKVENQGPLRATFDLGNGSEVLIGAKLAARMHLLTDGRSVATGAGGGVNIGVSILRQFIITTDFAKRAVWLEPRTAK